MTSTQSALILLLFLLLIALPFIPGVLFLKRRVDEQPLRVDPEYSRDPLFFGQELRNKYDSTAHGEAVVERHEQLTPALAAASSPSLLVTGDATTADAMTLGEAYLQSGGKLGAHNKVKAVVSDQSLHCGEQLQVSRFLEVKGDLQTSAESDLGISAAATGKLTLQGGTKFQRLYGQPIVVEGEPILITHPNPSVGDEYVWGGKSLRIPKGQVLSSGIICHGPLYIGEGSSVMGDIKVYGDLHLMQGALVSGSVVARGNVILHGKNVVEGHVHTEKNLFVGSGSVLGRANVQLSFYVAGRTVLTPQITLFGYLVTDRGGRVMRSSTESLGADFPLSAALV